MKGSDMKPASSVRPTFCILHCHVRRSTKRLTAGHWYFDTGAWVFCAQGGKSELGKFCLQVTARVANKPLESDLQTFDTESQAKEFLATHFGKPVFDVPASELPKEDEL